MQCFALIFLSLVYSVFGGRLPNDIPICKRNDPNIENCLLTSIEKIRPYLSKGIPEIRLPSFEPLLIPELKINRHTDSLKIDAKFTNVKAYGGTKFHIEFLKVDVQKLWGEVKISFPELHITADYDVKGTALSAPLDGKGYAKGNYTNINAIVQMTLKTTKISGVDHLKVEKVSTKLKVGGIKLNLEDPVHPDIAAQVTSFINENADNAVIILGPVLDDTANGLISTFFNQILERVSYEEIFPK